MNKIWHPYWEWECYKNGFYNTRPPDGIAPDKAKQMYAEFLSDLNLFGEGLKRVLKEWPNSCEHFLSNININRVAWLGQASMCIMHNIPACFRAGYKLLTTEQQLAADNLAAKYLELWEQSIK